MSLVDAFWADSNGHVRRLILDEVAGKTTGATEFNFDVFDLVLDFENGQAVVTDVLDKDSHDRVALSEFVRRAESFGDNPSVGDGLTAAERRPARFTIEASGVVGKRDEGAP